MEDTIKSPNEKNEKEPLSKEEIISESLKNFGLGLILSIIGIVCGFFLFHVKSIDYENERSLLFRMVY